MDVRLSPVQAGQVNLLSRSLDLPVDDVVEMLISGQLLALGEPTENCKTFAMSPS